MARCRTKLDDARHKASREPNPALRKRFETDVASATAALAAAEQRLAAFV